MCARRAWESGFHCSSEDRPKTASSLGRWYGSNASETAEAKIWDMYPRPFDEILDDFVPAIDRAKPLCRNLRKVLFPVTNDGLLDLTLVHLTAGKPPFTYLVGIKYEMSAHGFRIHHVATECPTLILTHMLIPSRSSPFAVTPS